MPVVVVNKKTSIVVNARGARQTIVAPQQPVDALLTSPAHIGIDADEKRVVLVRVGEPGPVGPKGEDAGPSNIAKKFIYSDLPGPIVIGSAIGNRKVLSVIVETIEEFDHGLTMAVGTDTAQGILLSVSENCLQAVGMYEKTANYEYEGTPAIKAFFYGGGPCVTGRAKITIFFT